MVDFRDGYIHESGSSSGTISHSMDHTMKMLYDGFPYASRYGQGESFENVTVNEEIIDHEEAVDMTDYDRYNRLVTEAQTPLYQGCDVTVLSAIMSHMQLKVKHKWSNISYDGNSEYIKSMLPKETQFPESHYKTKKILKDLGLSYEKIHACKNNCILFRGDFARDDECHVCFESRWEPYSLYKKKKVPVKVLRYFPLKPRLQRLYMSADTTKEMRWHGLERDDDDVLRHPVDGEAWKHFDILYPDFATDIRNVRVAIAIDGFNPWGQQSSSHSTWPVIVVPYNFPPWMLMKKEFNFMTLLIPGPKSLGKCLDVYMQPLIDELKDLWINGVQTFDRYTGTSFMMRAAVMWTISDFPAYGMLSSQTTKGYKACPVCLDNIHSTWHAGKVCYMGHRRWLPIDHEWWFDATAFDGKQEFDMEPRHLSGDEILEKLNSFDFGRLSSQPKFPRPKRPEDLLCWDHKSVFFELPYWSKLKQRHTIDGMHTEKNVFDSIIGTTFDFKEKTKDTVKSRVDLEFHGLRPHLWVKRKGSKAVIPVASYTVKPSLKPLIFKWFHDVKYAQGYALNIARCVKVEEQKISGMKTHDSHVLLQRLLPVVIRPYLPANMVDPLIALSSFWQKLCARELKKSDVLKLQLGGYKGYVRNRSNSEGSIAEAYRAHECVTYCNLYLHNADNTDSTNVDIIHRFNLSVVSKEVRMFGNLPNSEKLSENDLIEAHWCVLQHCEEVDKYRDYHKGQVQQRHKKEFPNYFQTWVRKLQRDNSSEYFSELQHLAGKPQSHNVYSACVVNSVKFLTERRDQGRKTQNCGVMVGGEDEEDAYYGIVVSVVELLYAAGMPIVLFKCRWFNTNPNVRRSTILDHGLLSMNTNTSWYENEPFILATTAKQVFYLDDPKEGGGWKIVNMMSHRNI
ncbi:uncharacterized protein LOC126803420 [Argentina anserina]|uniref:uncharacterized protein LOC126803420 n=1 Tax=Argentina anserina TaxID=57926 RepID=UPI0021768202|nr:uncharacterized protein LOC126803420 [Potentilla anserina]